MSVVRRKRVDDGDGLQAPRRRIEALDLAGGEVVAVEIAAKAPLDAGAQDLDRDLAAPVLVDDDRLVHLGDGGGGNRGTELGEMVLEPSAERLLDGAAGLGHGERRQIVLQLRKIPGELGPDHVGARRQKLAELDVARAQAASARRRRASRAARCARKGAATRRIGAVRTRARRSARGTLVPCGTKRTPCWARTTPALARRRAVGKRSGHECGRVLVVGLCKSDCAADCAEVGVGQVPHAASVSADKNGRRRVRRLRDTRARGDSVPRSRARAADASAARSICTQLAPEQLGAGPSRNRMRNTAFNIGREKALS